MKISEIVTKSRLIWIAILVVVVLLVVFAFQPRPVDVDSAKAQRGTLVVTVVDDGITRVRERYTINAPIQGRLVRTPLDAGDSVRKGETVVAEFAPITPNLLDVRSRDEALARIDQAKAAVREAEAREKQARADTEYFAAERARIEKLVAQDIRTDEAMDRAKRDDERAREALRAATFAVEMARFGRKLAEAALRDVNAATDEKHMETEPRRPNTVRLTSPVDGHVLRVMEESARTVAPGTPILEIGDIATLEIVADFLSQDAVKVHRGMPVAIHGWGGPGGEATVAPEPALKLTGVVRLVEPSGFTKISALGVEEQRVNIVIDPAVGSASWAPLGDGFRVEPHIELWRADDILLVPAGALFRKDGSWAVFAIDGGTARMRKIRIGRRTGLQAQVLDGLSAGVSVILYPSDLITEGTPVSERQ